MNMKLSEVLPPPYIYHNITVGKIIRFFVIILNISIEPRKMGG